MGLDIYHYKATLGPPVVVDIYNSRTVLAENFEGFDCDFNYFERFIQMVSFHTVVNTLIIPNDKSKIELTIDWFKDKDWKRTILFDADKQQLDSCICDFETENGLLQVPRHLMDAKDWRVVDYYTSELKKGFYYHEAGYQRKGMNRNFTRFTDSDIMRYTRVEDFLYAYSCVDYYWHSDKEADVATRKQNFKENFINKYEQGCSWMEVDD